VQPRDPFFCYIETAHLRGVISGYSDGTFRPANYATRGQIAKIVYQAILSPWALRDLNVAAYASHR
jgi:hypothetical protein